MNIDLNDMKLFVSVVQAGSLTKAADLLGIPKSRLSRRLTELERSLGTTLMDRTKKGVVLNELGSAFFEQTKMLLQQAEIAVQQVQGSLEQPRGLLKITTSADMMREIIAPHLAGYLRNNPQVNVDIRLSNTIINLIQGGVDIAIRAGKIDDENMVARKLLTAQLGIFATQTYLDNAPSVVAPNDLYRHHLLCKTDAAPWLFRQNAHQIHIEANHRISCNSFDLVGQMIDQNVGIGLLPILGSYIKPHFIRLLPDWQLPTTDINVLYYKQRGNITMIRSFVEYLRGRIVNKP